jgi:hypothetical protein
LRIVLKNSPPKAAVDAFPVYGSFVFSVQTAEVEIGIEE